MVTTTTTHTTHIKHDPNRDPNLPVAPATIPDTTSLSVPAKEDYENPVLSEAEETRKRELETQEANDEIRRKIGEQALEYYRQGITQPSESDIRVGMSHPNMLNRPGYSPDPVAERYELSEKTLSEQEAGKASTPKLAEEQQAGKKAVEDKKAEDKKAEESAKSKG